MCRNQYQKIFLLKPHARPPNLRQLYPDRRHVTPSSVRQPLARQRPEGIITNNQDNSKNTLAILCGREHPVGYI